MAGSNEDDFWNTSSSSGFNFDEEEDISNVNLKSPTNTDVFFTSHVDKTSTLSIHSIISKRNLSLILGDVEQKIHHSNKAPIEETIKNMFCGRKYTLACYRSLEHKTELLDQSIATGHGNIILTVALFLDKTLSRSVFLNLLSKREAAIRHYSSYLIFHRRFQDLADLYTATGYTSNLTVPLFLMLNNAGNRQGVLHRLEQNMSYLQSGSNWKDLFTLLNDYKQFLKWQIAKDSNFVSPVEELANLYKTNYKNLESTDLTTFRQLLKISDYQSEWILCNTLAMLQEWKKLTNIFISTNWLMKKKVLKSCLGGEVFIHNLYRHGAPVGVLEEFLSSNILDSEACLFYAKKMLCHKYVIDYYVSQKDRLGLLTYKNNIATQSEDFFYLENALYSPDKTWKN